MGGDKKLLLYKSLTLQANYWQSSKTSVLLSHGLLALGEPGRVLDQILGEHVQFRGKIVVGGQIAQDQVGYGQGLPVFAPLT